jgi:hypothetical protein
MRTSTSSFAVLRLRGLEEMQMMERSLAAIRSALGVGTKTLAVLPEPRTEIDETDAGNGMREIEENMSAQSFKDELAVLREANTDEKETGCECAAGRRHHGIEARGV